MNLRRSIACIALMISTGYSSLMSPDEFEKNLYGAMSNSYSFKDMKPQEPGLNESREYYRVVERFVADQFNDNKELLSLAIAAGKFGTNTEFMWTLYNMASMGALRVEGRYETPYERNFREEINNNTSPINSRKSSEEISKVITGDISNVNNPVIEERAEEEKEPEPKVVITEEKPKEFSEELKNSVQKKWNDTLNGDKKLSTLLDKMDSCQEVEYLETLLDQLNKDGIIDDKGQSLTQKTLNEMAEPVKAKLFLTKPTLADMGNNEEDFEIAKEIAKKNFRFYKELIYALLQLDLDAVNLIATNENYKNAIITYSTHDPRLRDNDRKPLTSDTFNQIVDAAKAALPLTKPTLANVVNNQEDFKIAKKIAEMKPAFINYTYLLGALTKLDPYTVNLIATSKKYKNAIIEYSGANSQFLKCFPSKKALTSDTFDEIVDVAKAKLLLTKPTSDDLDVNEEDFKIANRIAEMEPAFTNYTYLIDALTQLDLDALNFIGSNEKYKDAIITYSAYDFRLRDNDRKPLTSDTFNQIVVSVLVNKADNKETLAKIKTDFSTVIEKNEELKNTIEDKEKNL